mmetsp:Transcript_54151/g.108779  ORF Transcript_54151/g.108779 Transcript_54151/m.108779 type:complete len:203 (+) Transcript_54151:655-1263(+)
MTLTWLFGMLIVLLSGLRTTVSNKAISATFPKTPAMSTKSPTSYLRKTNNITPAARSFKRPCKAKPMASELMESTATKEVVEMPRMDATLMRSKALSPLLAKLMANLMKVGSTGSERSKKESSSTSLSSLPLPPHMPSMERIESCLLLLLSGLVDSSSFRIHDFTQLMTFRPIKRTATARLTFGNSANADAPICFNDSQITS